MAGSTCVHDTQTRAAERRTLMGYASRLPRPCCWQHSKMLDMFWVFRPDGKSYLDEKLKAEGVDTVVIAGLWTDECIVATAYAALSRGYDVVVVGDGVATATAHHDKALTVMNATCGKVLPTAEILKYMQTQFVKGEPGAVKGVRWPDGRKDNAPAPPWEGPTAMAKMLVPVAVAALAGVALGYMGAKK